MIVVTAGPGGPSWWTIMMMVRRYVTNITGIDDITISMMAIFASSCQISCENAVHQPNAQTNTYGNLTEIYLHLGGVYSGTTNWTAWQQGE